MHMLAVGLPASLIDNYCIGGDRSPILRSPRWTIHNRDQWGSQPYLETAIVPRQLRWAPQQERRAFLPMEWTRGQERTSTDRSKAPLFPVTLIYTHSCHLGWEEREHLSIRDQVTLNVCLSQWVQLSLLVLSTMKSKSIIEGEKGSDFFLCTST